VLHGSKEHGGAYSPRSAYEAAGVRSYLSLRYPLRLSMSLAFRHLMRIYTYGSAGASSRPTADDAKVQQPTHQAPAAHPLADRLQGSL